MVFDAVIDLVDEHDGCAGAGDSSEEREGET